MISSGSRMPSDLKEEWTSTVSPGRKPRDTSWCVSSRFRNGMVFHNDSTPGISPLPFPSRRCLPFPPAVNGNSPNL